MFTGSVVKIELVAYDTPFWRHHGYSGEAVTDEGLAKIVFDDCSGDGDQAALLAFIPGRRSSQGELHEEARSAAAGGHR